MKRREFLRYGAIGITALSAGYMDRRLARAAPAAAGSPQLIDRSLAIGEALFEMVDTTPVYLWAFEDPESGPRFPGPLIEANTGDTIRLSVTNRLDEEHAFAIPGVVDSGVIAPGATAKIQFVAPAAGTYLYFDPLNTPVNRALGLHGVLVVLPGDGRNNPYTSPTPAVEALFADLGNSEHFPGEPWKPARSRIWVLDSIDPRFSQMAMDGLPIAAERFLNEFRPRYFTINGESGAFASHNHDTIPSGRIGQPHLIRILNPGVDVHSPHIHGNHVYVVAVNGEVLPDARSVDTYTVWPGDRVDWLLPFMRPPDIPGDPALPLRVLAAEELGMVLGDVPQSPLTYPMHGHDELSQTAAGGNYPQGMVTTWEITGDVDGVDFPVPLVR